jgi:hypothetical protein
MPGTSACGALLPLAPPFDSLSAYVLRISLRSRFLSGRATIIARPDNGFEMLFHDRRSARDITRRQGGYDRAMFVDGAFR